MELAEYRPVSSLVVDSTPVDRPLYKVIDFHNHLSMPWDEGAGETDSIEARDRLDAAGVDLVVDLDGGWGEDILDDHLARFKAAHPDRFKIFGGVDWSAWPEHGDRFGDWAAGRLESQAARGAEGLKIWKALGLHVRDHKDRLVEVATDRCGIGK